LSDDEAAIDAVNDPCDDEHSYRSDAEPNTGHLLMQTKMSLRQMRQARLELARLGMLNTADSHLTTDVATEDCFSESVTILTDTASYMADNLPSLAEDRSLSTTSNTNTLDRLQKASNKLNQLSRRAESTAADLSDDDDDEEQEQGRQGGAHLKVTDMNLHDDDDDEDCSYGTVGTSGDQQPAPQDRAVGFLSLLDPDVVKKKQMVPAIRAAPKALGFLSLLDPTDMAKLGSPHRSESRDSTASPFQSTDSISRSDDCDSESDLFSDDSAIKSSIHSSDSSSSVASESEWQAYRTWLRQVVKAPQSEIDSTEQTTRMNIFLHFYRLDIPIEEINSRLIAYEYFFPTQQY
jgi:hypothetical protein